jgi:Flp pilus assembly protein TadG
MLVFSIFDLGRLFYVRETLEHAMRQAGRYAVTGSHLIDSNGNQMARVDSIIAVAKKAAMGLDITSIQISSVLGGSTGPGRAGGPGDTVTITMTTNLQMITRMVGKFFKGNGTYTFTVSTVFRNERFAISQTN